MSCKVLNLGEEIVKIKKDSKEYENKDLEEPFKDIANFLNSTPVSAKQKLSVVENKVIESRKEKFKCEKCDYKCQKESTFHEAGSYHGVIAAHSKGAQRH